jgi:DNA-binding response OmpR family regulator
MSNLTLLYAEDDRETLEGTSFLLRRLFSEIYTAKNGYEALSLYKEKEPNIVLLDINMPKLDGMEVARAIREENESTPIIFLSAHSETSRLLEAIDIGTYSYIIKPFRVEDLNKPILKLIDRLNGRKSFIDFSFFYTWDEMKNELYHNEKLLSITKNEILLIQILLKNRNRFLTAQNLAYEFYERTNKEFELNNIVQLISRFRKKVLKESGSEDFFIENIYGSGYRIK